MKTPASFCLVVAFLFDPTSGLSRFVTDNSTRTTDYERSDARNLFRLIADDLNYGYSVRLDVSPTALTPPVIAGLEFSMDQGRHLNGYNEVTGRLNRYLFEGRFFGLNVVQGLIRVVTLNTQEELYEGVWLLNAYLTFMIDEIHIQSRISYDGRWRGRTWIVRDGLFAGHWTNVEVNYLTRIQLLSEGERQIFGPSMGEPVINVTSGNAESIDVAVGNDGRVLRWWADDPENTGQLNDIILSFSPMLLRRVLGPIDRLVREAIGDRPYTAPRGTPVIAAANVSGYSCRRPP